jgi:hypothetical protein
MATRISVHTSIGTISCMQEIYEGPVDAAARSIQRRLRAARCYGPHYQGRSGTTGHYTATFATSKGAVLGEVTIYA